MSELMTNASHGLPKTIRVRTEMSILYESICNVQKSIIDCY